MAKKRVAKKGTKKRTVHKVVKKSSPVSARKIKPVSPIKRKLVISIRNLILFTFLFAVSRILLKFSVQEIYINLYSILSIISGFVALAFLLVTIIFLILRIIRR
jgi:hypothetical protein